MCPISALPLLFSRHCVSECACRVLGVAAPAWAGCKLDDGGHVGLFWFQLKGAAK